MNAGEMLSSKISGLRRRILLLGFTALLSEAVWALLIPFILLSGLFPIFPEHPLELLSGAAFLSIVLTALTLRWSWRRIRPLRSQVEVATLLGRDDALVELIVTGSDLAGWGARGADVRGADSALVAAQIALAEERASALSLSTAYPASQLIGSFIRGALALSFAAAVILVSPGGYERAIMALSGEGPNPPLTVGNLSLTVNPPAYTGLPGERFDGVSGDVEGYPGSSVTLEGRLGYPVDGGLWEGPEGVAIPLTISENRFSVSWILAKSGNYHLSFEKAGKDAPANFTAKTISLLQDERPRVSLIRPEADLEVPAEVEVEISWSGSDDFAVSRGELVLSGAEEVRIPLEIKPGPEVEGRRTFLPIAYPALGDGAYLKVELFDSDDVNGPKSGVSKSIYISFLSQRKLRADLEALEERLFEAMLSYLGDHLENPAPDTAWQDALRESGKKLLTLLDALTERAAAGLDEGVFGMSAITTIEVSLRRAVDLYLSDSKNAQPLVGELERDILFIDDLIKNLRMEEALTLGDELSALQTDLFERMMMGEDTKALMEAVEQIENMLQEIFKKISSQEGEMPDSFANSDAVKDRPDDKMSSLLDELKEALEKGDRERAAKLAEELMETLNEWLQKLEGAAKESLDSEISPEMKELQALMGRVMEQMAEQERILGETRKLTDEAALEALRDFKEREEDWLAKQNKRIALIENNFRDMERLVDREAIHGKEVDQQLKDNYLSARKHFFDTGRALREELRNDLGGALARAKSYPDALGEVTKLTDEHVVAQPPKMTDEDAKKRYGELHQDAGLAMEEIIKDLEELLEMREDYLKPAALEALKSLAEDEERLKQGIGDIEEALQSLSGKSPFIPDDLAKKAGEAGKSAGEAGKLMGGGAPFASLPGQGMTIQKLSELAKGMEDASNGAKQGAGSSGGGNRPHGQDGLDRSRVKLPAEEEAKQWRAFREDVLKRMREGNYPKNYEEEVERYYKRLIK
ncbi:MAG: hypothetical protein C0608_05970 [Deltaproteobacteria bacterium]|nr:MAG: hypothetical protein C0608_05970 [Deltaproteobacteria bacterium]